MSLGSSSPGRRLLVIVASLCTLGAASAGVSIWTRSAETDPAPLGSSGPCREVGKNVPEETLGDSLDGAARQGVASWGDGRIILRCGVGEIPPTVDPCVNANGVDWVLDEKRLEKEGVAAFTTYGRSPAVELTYSGAPEEATGALVDVNAAVSWLQQKRTCVGMGDL
ncbi:DUF3515 family protein [Streptomyces sp. NPDC060194]|uniref:DUF3515 family protein n=1 Tax=Streptomyces sp. NPDC060194 TaxID=3347069 RepID=UPI00364FEE98